MSSDEPFEQPEADSLLPELRVVTDANLERLHTKCVGCGASEVGCTYPFSMLLGKLSVERRCILTTTGPRLRSDKEVGVGPHPAV